MVQGTGVKKPVADIRVSIQRRAAMSTALRVSRKRVADTRLRSYASHGIEYD